MIYFDAVKNENIEIYIDGNENPFLVGAAINADGLNYYDFQKKIKAKYACVVNAATGQFRYVNEDPSTIAPSAGERVFGIDELPEDFFSYDYNYWAFDGTSITPYQSSQDELIATARATKAHLMSMARQAIDPLQDAVDENMATDTEMKSLSTWKKYRALLNRVITDKPEDINWPPIPDFTN